MCRAGIISGRELERCELRSIALDAESGSPPLTSSFNCNIQPVRVEGRHDQPPTQQLNRPRNSALQIPAAPGYWPRALACHR